MSEQAGNLPGPVRFECAKSAITACLADVHEQLGLSETETIAAAECVLSEQRSQMLRTLSAQLYGQATAVTDESEEA